MSKAGKKTVELQPARPSRIRRDPVRLQNNVGVERQVEVRSRQQEIWGGVAGVLLMAVVLSALTIGISAATSFRNDPAAAANAARFGQCYNSGPNCVIDGDTIRISGSAVQIAGIETPRIQGAACDAERSRGINAATRLAELLNSGKVTVSAAMRDDHGRAVRKVAVDGEDVGDALVDAGVAREPGGGAQGWCASADE